MRNLSQAWIWAIVGGLLLSTTVLAQRGRMPPPGRGMRGRPAGIAPTTAPAYAKLYAVPEQILGGKAAEWLEAQLATLDGIPLSKRHERRIREVFSASLAVRVAKLDAKAWGEKLYGTDTVARKVYDALGRLHAGELAALPVLIDAVPSGEMVGGGWLTMAHGLREASPKLGDNSSSEAACALIYAGVPESMRMGLGRETSRTLPTLSTVPNGTGEKLVDVILAAKGGAAWQEYCQSMEKFLRAVMGYGKFRSRPTARLIIGLCPDPEWKHKYFSELKRFVPELEEEVEDAYYEHQRKGRYGSRATLTLATRKQQRGAYAEAVALYREAETMCTGKMRRQAWQGLYATLVEASRKKVAVEPTWTAEQAQRKQTAENGDCYAQLAYADVLVRAGKQTEAGELQRNVFGATGTPDPARIVAWYAYTEILPSQTWALVKGHPEVFATPQNASEARTVLLHAVLADDFAGAAAWLSAVQQKAPRLDNQAREAVLWHAAGETEKAEALLAIPERNPKEALQLLQQFVQIDESWSSGGSAPSDAEARALREKLPPGRAWPLAARFALRIMESPVLRRERSSVAAWSTPLTRYPREESAENAALARKLDDAVLSWGGEVPPVALEALGYAPLVLGGRPKDDTVRAESASRVAAGAFRLLAARGVPETQVANKLSSLASSCQRGRLPTAQYKEMRVALADTYPGLLPRLPEPKEQ